MAVDLSILMSKLDVVHKDLGFPDSIESFTNDSRQIKPGDIFIAVAGTERAGSDFLPDAQAQGAVGAIVDDSLTIPAGVTIPILRVADAREALSLLAREHYGNPSRELLVDAFIGTKGKTTSTYMAKSVFEAFLGAGKSGVIGTLGAHGGGVEDDTKLTTPESNNLHRILAEFLESGVGQVSIEYTAHAIALRRGMHIRFTSGVFISFSQDHLDFFGTMDDYLAVKTKFFSERAGDENFQAIVNIDDPASEHFISAMNGRALTFGRSGQGDVRAENVKIEKGLSSFDLAYEGEKIHIKLNAVGTFNISNALAAAALGIRHGAPLGKIAEGLSKFEPVPGRLEVIREGQPFEVLVDYAHSPESVRAVLEAVAPFGYGRIISVMGAGGDRDHSKRPLMGIELIRGSDIVIVTTDNPRTEDPGKIIEDILTGIRDSGIEKEYHSEPDRKLAIKMALETARPGDAVLILGKGAEDYMEIDGVRHPFDDRLISRELLREMRDRWN